MGEFELIERFFKRAARQADVGIGDDCAIWTPSPGHQLAISADMLVEGRHFLSTVNPRDLGHKALAVNLSDLAACVPHHALFYCLCLCPGWTKSGCQAFQKACLPWPMHRGVS